MFAPMFDRIVIEPLAETEEKIGSLFIAPGAQSPYTISKVIDVGPGIYLPDGKLRPIHAKKGEYVLHNKTTVLTYEKGKETVHFICERDIVAKWSPDKE